MAEKMCVQLNFEGNSLRPQLKGRFLFINLVALSLQEHYQLCLSVLARARRQGDLRQFPLHFAPLSHRLRNRLQGRFIRVRRQPR